ncbi:conserved protein of unknown function [Pseudomonas syringae pv. tomato str. DC3000]|uniref:DUF2946 domain-containing protein n=3 Tax=Pseudomonas TaxID=286 RepID=Q881P2_PSESM|nr:conserved protein of unknown function [Pseudomonas syringae pv. tomato str. DC3000]MBW8021887.1 DUF2946 domain-containing protein [Pseudomonas syringae pv. tomato]
MDAHPWIRRATAVIERCARRVERLPVRERPVIGAWLSLFAMLMIFVGPLISQGISLVHGKSQSMSMAGMECHDMPGMSQMSHHGSADRHHDLIVWEKCGYCSLLFQNPALIESNLAGFRLTVPPLQYLPARFITRQTAPPVFPGARSRAPPINL